MSEPQSKRSKMSNCLEQLKAQTVVVADTGDFEGKTFLACHPGDNKLTCNPFPPRQQRRFVR